MSPTSVPWRVKMQWLDAGVDGSRQHWQQGQYAILHNNNYNILCLWPTGLSTQPCIHAARVLSVRTSWFPASDASELLPSSSPSRPASDASQQRLSSTSNHAFPSDPCSWQRDARLSNRHGVRTSSTRRRKGHGAPLRRSPADTLSSASTSNHFYIPFLAR